MNNMRAYVAWLSVVLLSVRRPLEPQEPQIGQVVEFFHTARRAQQSRGHKKRTLFNKSCPLSFQLMNRCAFWYNLEFGTMKSARSAATQLAVKNHMKSPEIPTRRYLIRA